MKQTIDSVGDSVRAALLVRGSCEDQGRRVGEQVRAEEKASHSKEEQYVEESMEDEESIDSEDSHAPAADCEEGGRPSVEIHREEKRSFVRGREGGRERLHRMLFCLLRRGVPPRLLC